MQDQVSPSISDACVEWMESFRCHVPSLDIPPSKYLPDMSPWVVDYLKKHVYTHSH